MRRRLVRGPDPDPAVEHVHRRTEAVAPGLLASLRGDPLVEAANAAQELAGNRAVGALLQAPIVQRDGPTHEDQVPLPAGSGAGQQTATADEPALPGDPAGQAMFAALRTSALGRRALAIAKQYQVTLDFNDTGAPGGKIAGYAPSNNRCYLKRTIGAGQLGAYFVHEMHHAQRFRLGKSPVAEESPDRDAYVERMVDEEVTATTLSFESRLDMDPNADFGTGVLAECFIQFKRVRGDWTKRHLAEHPGDTEGAAALAQKKGRDLVRWQIRGNPGDDGSRRLPTLGPERDRSYFMFYRDEWTKARGPAGGAKGGERRTEAEIPPEIDPGETAVASAQPGATGDEAATATA